MYAKLRLSKIHLLNGTDWHPENSLAWTLFWALWFCLDSAGRVPMGSVMCTHLRTLCCDIRTVGVQTGQPPWASWDKPRGDSGASVQVFSSQGFRLCHKEETFPPSLWEWGVGAYPCKWGGRATRTLPWKQILPFQALSPSADLVYTHHVPAGPPAHLFWAPVSSGVRFE